MSKPNNNNDFKNEAAKRFRDLQKSDLLSQKEVFRILDNDLQAILEQMTNSRNHKGKYPQYVANIFANLSSALFFSQYVEDNVKVKKGKLKTDLAEDDVESLREILYDAYKKSAINFYDRQSQEFVDRNKIISKAFIMLCPKEYKIAKKFGLDDGQTRDLVLQVYGPVENMKYVKRLIDSSTLGNKKKLKLLRAMYGKKRFIDAVGAALTVTSNNSDCIEMLYSFMMGKKLKKRAPYVRAYAEAYKKAKTRNFRINDEFLEANKKLIKELKRVDVGYKKAFTAVAGKTTYNKKDDKKSKKENTLKITTF